MEQTSGASCNIFWANPHFYHHRTASTGSSPVFCSRNTPIFNFNLNSHEDEEDAKEQLTDEREMETTRKHDSQALYQEEQEITIPKEPMFEKPLTPSDVGKLNRLVIPKQHAEKYFPLGGAGSSGGDSGREKGMLLSFEDESGKSWRFRYSYWNSSQSYVLTKGWSRFVKEKKLDVGDVVLFERHRLDGDRFFIGWRRRTATATPTSTAASAQENTGVGKTVENGGGGGWTQAFYSAHPYPSQHPNGPHLPYQPDCPHAGSLVHSQLAPSSNSKRSLRLFGVNLECQPDTDEFEPPTPDGSSISSQDHANYYYHQQCYYKAHAPNHHNHMDPNFSRDLNQMRYHQG